ncbi:MAG: hypothetical protein ABI165_06300 [Bryobacteraceae bacterium]
MIKKLGLCLGTFALAVASAAGSSYHVTLSHPAVVAGSQIRAGEYQVRVDNGKVTLKDGKTSVEANVKVENDGRKFRSTSVIYHTENGQYRIAEIHIGGTHTKLMFEE